SSPAPRATPARSATPPRTAPPAPTYLSMGVRTSGGRIDLARGGAPQEFTVTLDNGNTRAYPQLKLVFQMEMLIDGRSADQAPQDGFLLQRWDPASGVWRNEPLRIANDTVPPHLHGGGTPLARDAVRTVRYRLTALDQGPTGSTPLMVTLIDTAADTRVAYHYLPHTTRRP
ncbi:hypothetical protein, partial [Streptomyces sp. CC77]|uniref:hypothetical protein n=1 Tax=Streptomyces sp. CC77 TaxID=1906739 RepID=UPI001C314847